LAAKEHTTTQKSKKAQPKGQNAPKNLHKHKENKNFTPKQQTLRQN